MSAINGNAAVYVCENFTCKAPVTDPKALRDLLEPLRCAKRVPQGRGYSCDRRLE